MAQLQPERQTRRSLLLLLLLLLFLRRYDDALEYEGGEDEVWAMAGGGSSAATRGGTAAEDDNDDDENEIFEGKEGEREVDLASIVGYWREHLRSKTLAERIFHILMPLERQEEVS